MRKTKISQAQQIKQISKELEDLQKAVVIIHKMLEDVLEKKI